MKVSRNVLLLTLAAIALFLSPALAQDAAEAGTQEPIKVDPELLEKAKKEHLAAQRKTKRGMESCLTLVRSYYGSQDQMVQEFVQEHPTQDKSRLLSKVLAQMMIRCTGAIQDDQVKHLQQFKQTPLDVNYKSAGYPDLILVDWESLKPIPANLDEGLQPGEGSGPVEMTQQEVLMSNQVEDLSDELKRESDEDLRGSLGKTSIAFIDIENMGFFSNLLIVVTILSLFAGIGYYFYNELVLNDVDINEDRKEQLRARREKKGL